jgi:hypothetical protein
VAGHSLELLPEAFAVCRLEATAPVPEWAVGASFCSITRTAAELSIVCEERLVPEAVRHDRGWRCLRLVGPFDLDLTGVLVSVLRPLADAGVSIFAVSTFDTDYVLVRSARVEQAKAALRAAGHRVD